MRPVTRVVRALRRAVPGAAACAALAGCLPASRLNDACRWTDPVAMLPPPGDAARRAHLAEDVQVAQWLGVRHGDVVVGRVYSQEHRDARAACTDASMRAIMTAHGVARAELDAVTGARVPWVDVLTVLLPAALLFAGASRLVVRRIVAEYDASDRWLAVVVLAVLTPIAAGFALGGTQMLAWLVESVRLRDEHVSFRIAYAPGFRHPWLVWSVAMALFAGFAGAAVRGLGAAASGARGRASIRYRTGRATRL